MSHVRESRVSTGLMLWALIRPLLYFWICLSFFPEDGQIDRRTDGYRVAVCKPSTNRRPTTDPSVQVCAMSFAAKLKDENAAGLRAVTGWVRLAGAGEKRASVWNSVVDGERHGCGVTGQAKLDAEGRKFTVDLTGWTPVGAHVEGAAVLGLVGSQCVAAVRLAEGDAKVHAWVALSVHAPGDAPESTGR